MCHDNLSSFYLGVSNNFRKMRPQRISSPVDNRLLWLDRVTQLEADRPRSRVFTAGSAGLDYLNSLASPVAELRDGDAFLDWLERAQLLSHDAATAIRKTARLCELDAVAAQARALGEWFQAFIDAHRGRPLSLNALRELEPLNRLLERDQQFEQIVLKPAGEGGKSPLRRLRLRHWTSPEALILPIAAALTDVVCRENFSAIKACEGASCSRLYVDRTPRLTRRWCSMAICGNRSKQAAHRVRKIAERPQ